MKTKIYFTFLIALLSIGANAQCHLVRADSQFPDTLSFSFSGGSFASFGCPAIDPTYWMSGSGMSITITFVTPQSFPKFNVWGMNSDDIASVTVNGTSYSLDSTSAWYDTKVVCGLSPGPHGVAFVGGNLQGANSPTDGNYSYQDVQLLTTGVSTITITGIAGAGWGFYGVYVNCPQHIFEGINEPRVTLHSLQIFPNPTESETTIQFNSMVKNASLEILNVFGQKVKTINHISGSEIKIQRDDLLAGIYFIQLLQNNQTISTGKLFFVD